MTCQECEIKLGMGEDASEHLASCAECHWLAEELRLNAQALREMRVRPRVHWEWALAAAAAILMTIGVWRVTRAETVAITPVRIAAAAPPLEVMIEAPRVIPVKRRIRRQPVEPLRVKMYTSDPDVVIYWIVGGKVGSE